MISQKRGKCGGESENTPDSLKATPSSLEFPQLSQVGTSNNVSRFVLKFPCTES